jgi:two-component system, sensor histidine kinase ChiS
MKNNTNKKKVLIVDDEPHIRQLVRRTLDGDFDVLEASDGKEAIEKAYKAKPDFILMDLMMPVMDGFTSCYEIKHNPATKNIPVFMLTAVVPARNKQVAQEVWGANGYLTKPVDIQELLDTITHFLPAG